MKQSRDADDVNPASVMDAQDASGEVGTRAQRFAVGSELGDVAAVLTRHRHEILNRWLRAASGQPFHRGHHRRAVADHVPSVFDELLDVVLPSWTISDRHKGIREQPLQVAHEYANTRFEQGLSGSDVVTEFRLLRQEIGRALRLYLPGTVASSDVIAAELLLDDALDAATALALSSLRQSLDESREDVLATTVHDIRQPAAGIRGYLQLAFRALERSDPNLDNVATYIQRAEAQARRMVALVDGLTEVSRLALGRFELRHTPGDLLELVRDVILELEPTTGQRVHLAVPPDTDARGSWDMVLLERVIVNLLSNAAKYSPVERPIWISLRADAESVQLSIQDYGIGLAAEESARLFRRYARAPGAVELGIHGLGLGLYLCRGVVEAHGGRIWAESLGRGRGTTIHLVLPRQLVRPHMLYAATRT